MRYNPQAILMEDVREFTDILLEKQKILNWAQGEVIYE